jgi:hypothetical protein
MSSRAACALRSGIHPTRVVIQGLGGSYREAVFRFDY